MIAIMRNLVIFDIDGTLIDSMALDTLCFIRAFKDEFRIAYVDDRWENYNTTTDAGIFEEIYRKEFNRKPDGHDTRRMIRRFVSYMENHLKEKNETIRPIPGACEILDAVNRNREWCAALATGAWRESARFKLRRARLNVDNIPLMTSTEEKIRESIVEACINKAKNHYHVQGFERIVSVGDAIWDVRTAERLGLTFIGVGNTGIFKEIPGCRFVEDFRDAGRFWQYLNHPEGPGVKQEAPKKGRKLP